MNERHAFYAPCARGLEPLLAEELRALRARGVRPQRGGVLFAGSVTDGYRALLWSRFASRVLLSLGEVAADSADALYAGIREVAWEDHLRADGTLTVDANGVNEALRNTQFTAVKVKDAVVDRFRDRFGRRPSVDSRDPDVRLNVTVLGAKAKLAIDLSGTPLHRRGYREQGVQVAAPMKETLAAAVLGFAGWKATAESGGAFLDPLCGSGTLAIEAALVACDVAPGLLRREWGFDRWLGHDEGAWEALRADAAERRTRGLSDPVPIEGSDADRGAVEIARRFVRRAGLESVVRIEPRALADAVPPADASRGLLACNPPYGERLADRRDLPALYAELSRVMSERLPGWDLAVITSDESLQRGLGMRADRSYEVFNGRIPAKVHVFGPGRATDKIAVPGPTAVSDASVEAFTNRLRKMAKHYGTWARRTGVSCYRVYDADLPDYNVAIDVYAGAGPDEGRTCLRIAEYAPPAGIDEERASQRMENATAIAADVLGVDPAQVFVKRRERQRGSAQYQREAGAGETLIVSENGLTFEVNLSDYLDTGLFLDHRDTRAWLRELVAGKRFLNLYAYTGTATVYAAAGGAVATTTVDLSATYLDWARRNLGHNGLAGDAHAFVRADTMTWLAEVAASPVRYDLVFCDPPTFSNSKRMDDTFDVQRDHVALVTAAAAVLAEGGLLVFSCNRKRFQLDEEALTAAGLEVRDVTRRTVPKDFDRGATPHVCWTVRRR